ncbi:MAG: LysE family translocator [Bacteroidales bacterium]|jgi:threonine/homoserine/homoserine lactone efflux protein|nr:LysE family translocator [Bacteroidales bacterium]
MLTFHAMTRGILFGLTLSLMIGPAFFSLIQTSITRGFRSGTHLAMGISLSDIAMVFIAWFGLSALFETSKAQNILSVVGGSVLIGFGIYTALLRHKTTSEKKLKEVAYPDVTKYRFRYMAKGFVFNIANPSIWIYWLIPISVATSVYSKKFEQMIFLISILITCLTCDILKCAIAHTLKRFMTDRVLTIINRIVGIILILFGVYLIATLFINPPTILENLQNK